MTYTPPPAALCERLIATANAFYEVDIMASIRSRVPEAVEARQSVWVVLLEHGWSRSRIARRFGVNPSSIGQCQIATPERLATNQDFATVVATLRRVANNWREQMGAGS